MKKLIIALIFLFAGISSTLIINGCTSVSDIASKSGSKLWGENCNRCHNSPSPSSFNNEQWETVGIHMRLTANLTEEEINKIVSFLKTD